jgi:hypothetical protein
MLQNTITLILFDMQKQGQGGLKREFLIPFFNGLFVPGFPITTPGRRNITAKSSGVYAAR